VKCFYQIFRPILIFQKKVSGFGSWQSGIKIPEVQLWLYISQIYCWNWFVRRRTAS